MSIGNLKDQGNQGKNTPYQLRNLQSQGVIIDALNALIANAGGSETTPNAISSTGPGSLSAFLVVYNVSFYNQGAASGTLIVNGVSITLPAGATMNFDPGVGNHFKGSKFSWTATGTTFLVAYSTN